MCDHMSNQCYHVIEGGGNSVLDTVFFFLEGKGKGSCEVRVELEVFLAIRTHSNNNNK